METALKGITVAGGYVSEVGDVNRGKINPLDLQRFPAVLIFPNDDEPQALIGDLIDYTWEILLFAWVRVQKDISKGMEVFLADIKKALLVDYTRGGFAIDTAEGPVRPIRIEEDDNQGGFLLSYTVRYRTKRGDPFSQS